MITHCRKICQSCVHCHGYLGGIRVVVRCRKGLVTERGAELFCADHQSYDSWDDSIDHMNIIRSLVAMGQRAKERDW
jgi:hypothetical protein